MAVGVFGCVCSWLCVCFWLCLCFCVDNEGFGFGSGFGGLSSGRPSPFPPW